jgi:cytochrome c
VRAAYEDGGAGGLPSLKSEQSFVLRNAKIDVHGFDAYDNIMKISNGGMNLAIASKAGAYMMLKQIDLNAVTALKLQAMAPKPQLNAVGGKVELRQDSPTGKLIGESEFLEASDKLDFKPTLLTVPVKLTDKPDGKLHDVYVVFVNPKAEEHSLMLVVGSEFVLGHDAQ